EVLEAGAVEHNAPPPPSPLPQGEGENRILVANKIDRLGSVPHGAMGVSALTGAGLPALRARLMDVARALTEAGGPPPLTPARHRAALVDAAARLADAQAADLPELRGE